MTQRSNPKAAQITSLAALLDSHRQCAKKLADLDAKRADYQKQLDDTAATIKLEAHAAGITVDGFEDEPLYFSDVHS